MDIFGENINQSTTPNYVGFSCFLLQFIHHHRVPGNRENLSHGCSCLLYLHILTLPPDYVKSSPVLGETDLAFSILLKTMP